MTNYPELVREEEAKFDEALRAYNEAFRNEDKEKMAEAKDAMDEAKAEYANDSKKAFYYSCLTKENPVAHFVRVLRYQEIYAKEGRDGRKSKQYKDVLGNLRELYAFAEERAENVEEWVAKNNFWKQSLISLAVRLIYIACSDLGASEADRRKLQEAPAYREIAREIEMHKENASNPDPTSKTQLMNKVQEIISALIGEEYVCEPRDVNVLLRSLIKKKRSEDNTYSALTEKDVYESIADMAHRMLINGTYTVKSRVPKN